MYDKIKIDFYFNLKFDPSKYMKNKFYPIKIIVIIRFM